MTFEPLLEAPLAVQFHIATVLPAAALGALLLARPKGTPLHRLLGKVWLFLMLATSLSTFFIHGARVIGPFGPIHLLSAYVVAGCIPAIRSARRGDIRAHRAHVAGMYFGGIVVAGLFTLLPHRVLGRMVFDGASGLVSTMSAAAFIGVLVAAGLLAVGQAGWGRRFLAGRRPR